MTLDRQIDVEELPVNPQTGTLPVALWGTWLFIATEAMLFAALISSYFYIRFGADQWPLGGIEPPELVLAGLGTVLLVSSSLTAHWAERGAGSGSRFQMRLGLALTVLLGMGFIGIQAYEYTHSTFGPTTNAYGSLFFGITGFHGLHVIVGLIMLLTVGTVAWRTDRYDAEHHLPLRLAILYWHFVDIVWIFVFASLYVSVRLQ
ncbi:MAG: cytochrome c oxidase subunit 3 [Acidimicrobiia bacterium]